MKTKFSILCIFLFMQIKLISQNTPNYPDFNIDPNLLKRHVEVLGSDLFGGRGTGTKGGELAASYIAEVFNSINLLPIGDNKTYYQSVPLHGTKHLNDSKLFFYTNDEEIELTIGKDYLLSNSGEQTLIPKASELVFVGYGIIAPEFDHNDYLDKDLVGKIAVMLIGEPESEYREYFNGDEPTIYGYPDVKHRVAISRGAAGTILIPPLNEDDEKIWKKLINDYSFEDIKLSYNASNSFGIILNPIIVRKLFLKDKVDSHSQISHANIRTDSYQLMFEGKFLVRDFKAENVVGIIKAKNVDIEEYVIVSAHYDHLGFGPEINGDGIYNGVLDNAIGVAALLEVAKEIKRNEKYLKRSVIFLATTGEEKGLLGSSYYVDHPIFPLYKTVANVNIDGIAFLDKFKAVVGIGGELSNLSDFLAISSGRYNLPLEQIPSEFYSYEAFNRSDQIAFAKAGIPSILVYDYPDYINLDRSDAIQKIRYYNNNIYHTPFDDLNLQLDYDAAVQHTKILSSFIFDISTSGHEIKWKDNSPYNYMRLQTIAEKR